MYKFLLIEDSASDIDAFETSIKRLNAEEMRYQLETASSYEEGLTKVNGAYNGVIVDINFDGDDENDGNTLIREIAKQFRIPVAIFTGTPADQDDGSPIRVFKKGEALHDDIIHELCAVSDTGLFKVLSGTGKIEKLMTKVFWDNLYPQISLWKAKKAVGIDTEKILLRYAISHIQELIDDDLPAYVTEEMYICPPIDSIIKTGSIVQHKENNTYYIVLSPPCDLAMHNGTAKSDCVLVCEIESQDDVHSKILTNNPPKKDADKVKRIKPALNNNYTAYYHWLPKNSLFCGGYINFRKATSYTRDSFVESFSSPVLKIQEGFVKSILGRFSAYYARQGQPDFDFDAEAAEIIAKLPVPTGS